MASVQPRIVARSVHQVCRQQPRFVCLNARRYASTKHPKGFVPPTQADLQELRESVQEFARVYFSLLLIISRGRNVMLRLVFPGREIPEDVALKTDRDNEFPNTMWKKFGEAGFLGITADEEYGGLGMGYQAHCVVLEELSRASGQWGSLPILSSRRTPAHSLE
jgi:isovaleryl-CoA dehydrogenase